MLLADISLLTLYRIILSVLTNVPLPSLTETAAEELRREHISLLHFQLFASWTESIHLLVLLRWVHLCMWMKQEDNNCVSRMKSIRIECSERVVHQHTRPAGSCSPGTPAGSCSWIYTPDQAGSWWGSVGQECLCILTHSQSELVTCSHRRWSRRLHWPAHKHLSCALFSYTRQWRY